MWQEEGGLTGLNCRTDGGTILSIEDGGGTQGATEMAACFLGETQRPPLSYHLSPPTTHTHTQTDTQQPDTHTH